MSEEEEHGHIARPRGRGEEKGTNRDGREGVARI